MPEPLASRGGDDQPGTQRGNILGFAAEDQRVLAASLVSNRPFRSASGRTGTGNSQQLGSSWTDARGCLGG